MILDVIPGRAQREPGIQPAPKALYHRRHMVRRYAPRLDSGFRLRRPRNDGLLAALLLVFFVLFSSSALAAPKFPALTGRVVDEAQILSPQTEASLTEKSEALEQKTHHQFVVVTLKDLQGYDIADYGYQLGRQWGIGGKGANDGVLLIIAPNERKVRIEVGYGLEPVLTDALSSVILQTRVLPKFRSGDMEAGIVDGADAIVTQIGLDPAEQQKVVQAAAQKPKEKSDGFPVWVIFFILFWIFVVSSRGRRYRRGGLGSAIPWIVLGSMAGRGGRSTWSSGGGSWGGGGGGFSGGGGSFGGGGASGGW